MFEKELEELPYFSKLPSETIQEIWCQVLCKVRQKGQVRQKVIQVLNEDS